MKLLITHEHGIVAKEEFFSALHNFFYSLSILCCYTFDQILLSNILKLER
jgi:hypothetical protein